jgi:hypothetical protein
LDIEYAAEHKYFDWDKKQFPDPVKMQNEVGALGRKVSRSVFGTFPLRFRSAEPSVLALIVLSVKDGRDRRPPHQEIGQLPSLQGRH